MKRRLMNITKLIGVLAVSLMLAACSLFGGEEGDVRDAVDATMKIFKFAENSDAASFADQNTIDTLSAYGVDANEFLAYCFKHLEWEIGDVKISGNTASVAVTITNINLGTALERAGELFETFSDTDEAHELFDEQGESALVEKLFSYFYEVVDSGEVATTSSDVTVTVVKDDEGTWTVDPDNDALYRALYGGADFNF